MDGGLGSNASVDAALAAIVGESGVRSWADAPALRAKLNAALPGGGWRVDLLMSAVESGIVAEIAALPARDTMREAQLAQRLVFERFLADSDARFAVEAWSRALHEPAAPRAEVVAAVAAAAQRAAQPAYAQLRPTPPMPEPTAEVAPSWGGAVTPSAPADRASDQAAPMAPAVPVAQPAPAPVPVMPPAPERGPLVPEVRVPSAREPWQGAGPRPQVRIPHPSEQRKRPMAASRPPRIIWFVIALWLLFTIVRCSSGQ